MERGSEKDTERKRERNCVSLAVPGPCFVQKARSDYRHCIVLWPRKVGEILDSREDSWIVASESVVLEEITNEDHNNIGLMSHFAQS